MTRSFTEEASRLDRETKYLLITMSYKADSSKYRFGSDDLGIQEYAELKILMEHQEKCFMDGSNNWIEFSGNNRAEYKLWGVEKW